jgi:hypothetical protein
MEEGRGKGFTENLVGLCASGKKKGGRNVGRPLVD